MPSPVASQFLRSESGLFVGVTHRRALLFPSGNAIRDLRGEAPTHGSMLINVSRFTAVQDQVASLVHEQLSTIQQDIRNYSQLPAEQAFRNSSLARAERVWSGEYSNAGFSWAVVQRSLLNSVLRYKRLCKSNFTPIMTH